MTLYNLIALLLFLLFRGGVNGSLEEPIPSLPNEFPFHAAVQQFNDFWGFYVPVSSAIILDEKHVLAQRQTWPMDELSVVVGRQEIGNILLGKRHKIKQIISHPGMCNHNGNVGNQDYPIVHDLSILELETAIEFNIATQPAILPKFQDTLQIDNGYIIGWPSGVEDTGNVHKLFVPETLNRSECSEYYGKYRIRDEMLCAVFFDEDGVSMDMTSLTFDEGGAYLCQRNQSDTNSLVVCGINTFTPISNNLCEEPSSSSPTNYAKEERLRFVGYPAVITLIQNYIPWIIQTITANSN